MNVGSLFSGIGGMDHGLAAAGFRHVFFCESDEWRRTVLEHHWPGVPVHHDVRDVGMERASNPQQPRRVHTGLRRADLHSPSERRNSGNTCDLLAGGFPCQDLSPAGRRAGLNGERSGLFFEFARIAKTIRPQWILLENVPGLLTSNAGRDFGIVVGTLADIGFGVAYRILDSKHFGVPQRRRRVYIVATSANGDPRAAAERAGQVLAVGSRCPRHSPQGAQTGPGTAGDSLGSPGTGIPDVIAFSHTQGLHEQSSMEAWPFLRKGGGGHAVSTPASVRRLTPVECERLQALPDQWTAHGPDSRRYAALGDAVTSSVAEWIGRRILAA